MKLTNLLIARNGLVQMGGYVLLTLLYQLLYSPLFCFFFVVVVDDIAGFDL